MDLWKITNSDSLEKTPHTKTTIVAVAYTNGFILASDRRTSLGSPNGGVEYIYSDQTNKLRRVLFFDFACAGSVAHIQSFTENLERILEIYHTTRGYDLTYNFFFDVCEALILRNQLAMAFLGINPFTRQIKLYQGGFADTSSRYLATGSGMIHVNPILDQQWRENMNLDEALELVTTCLRASRTRDPASGGGMDYIIYDLENPTKCRVTHHHL